METIDRRQAKRMLHGFKRKLEQESDDVAYLNITAMMDMMTILLVFLLKSWSVSVENVQISEVEPPKSTIAIQLADALKIQITPNSIIVEGEAVVPVRNGSVAPSYKKNGANDFYIVPLEAIAEQHAKREKKIAGMQGSEWKGELSLIADKNTPYRLISEVLYSVGQAGFHNFRLVTLKPGEEE